MSTEARIQSFVSEMSAGLKAAPEAASPEAIGDRITALIEALRVGFENIDETEAAEILEKLAQAGAAFAAGNWISGTLAMLAAMRLYRQAKRD